MWCGCFIVAVGVILLLDNAGILSGPLWNYVLPAGLIVWGAGIMLGKGWMSCCPFAARQGDAPEKASLEVRDSRR